MKNQAAILERYRQSQTGSGWHTAPDDGYLYNHLAVLLKEAGLVGELKALFADANWMQARVQQSNYDGFLADLSVAWEIALLEAEEQIASGIESAAFLDCLHYTLIESSLRSRAESLTPAIVVQAVKTEIWTAERALSLAALIPDEQRRAAMYAALAKTENLTTEQSAQATTEALEVAETIDYAWSRASILSSLSDQTDDEQQHQALASALEAALQAADGMFGSNGYGMYELISKLPDDLLARALEGVLALRNADARAWALSQLAKRRPEEQRYDLLERGVNAALEVKGDVSIANALAQLADQLTGELVNKALDGALALKEGDWRPRAIAGLMDKLDAQQVERVLESMLSVENEWWRADGLMRVAEHSTDEMQRRALATLLRGQHGETFAKIQGWLEYFGSIELLETALEVAQTLEDDGHRARWQLAIEALLSQKRKEAEILSLTDLIAQAKAFLDEAQAEKARGENPEFLNAYMTIMKIEDETERERLMNRIRVISGEANTERQWASSDELDRVLQEQYEEERSQRLQGIAGRLPDDLLPRALEAAFAFEETLHRDWAFEGLAARLSGDLLKQALEPSFLYEDKVARNHALNSLAKKLEEPVRSEVVTYALDTVVAVQQPYWSADQLIQMIPNLQGEAAGKAAARLFELAQTMTNDELRLHALAAAVEYLEGNLRQEALTMVLDNLWTYSDGSETISILYEPGDPMLDTHQRIAIWHRMQITARILKYVTDEQKATILPRALDMTLGLKEGTWFVSALRELAPYLEGVLLKQAFDVASNLKDESQRAEAITVLIDRLSPEDLLRVIEIAATVEQPGQRAALLIAVAKRLDSEHRSTVISQAYEAALLVGRETSRIRLLTELARLGSTEAAARALDLAQSWNDVQELNQWLTELSKEGVEQSVMRYIERNQSQNADWDRTAMIASLLPFAPNQADLLKTIRRGMVTKVRDLRSGKRADVLYFCMDNATFTPPILSQQQTTALIMDVFHVCRDWRWA